MLDNRPAPFIPHKSGLPKEPVHLLRISAAPEGKHGAEGQVGFAVAGIALTSPCQSFRNFVFCLLFPAF